MKLSRVKVWRVLLCVVESALTVRLLWCEVEAWVRLLHPELFEFSLNCRTASREEVRSRRITSQVAAKMGATVILFVGPLVVHETD